MVFATATQICCCSMKATNKGMSLPVKLYLQNQVVDQFCQLPF